MTPVRPLIAVTHPLHTSATSGATPLSAVASVAAVAPSPTSHAIKYDDAGWWKIISGHQNADAGLRGSIATLAKRAEARKGLWNTEVHAIALDLGEKDGRTHHLVVTPGYASGGGASGLLKVAKSTGTPGEFEVNRTTPTELREFNIPDLQGALRTAANLPEAQASFILDGRLIDGTYFPPGATAPTAPPVTTARGVSTQRGPVAELAAALDAPWDARLQLIYESTDHNNSGTDALVRLTHPASTVSLLLDTKDVLWTETGSSGGSISISPADAASLHAQGYQPAWFRESLLDAYLATQLLGSSSPVFVPESQVLRSGPAPLSEMQKLERLFEKPSPQMLALAKLIPPGKTLSLGLLDGYNFVGLSDSGAVVSTMFAQGHPSTNEMNAKVARHRAGLSEASFSQSVDDLLNGRKQHIVY